MSPRRSERARKAAHVRRKAGNQERAAEYRQEIDDNTILSTTYDRLSPYLGDIGAQSVTQLSDYFLPGFGAAATGEDALDILREADSFGDYALGAGLGGLAALELVPVAGALAKPVSKAVRGGLKGAPEHVLRFAGDEYGGVPAFNRPSLTPAEQQADDVLAMLREGRADDVTDEMMAAADDAYLFNNYDLPMDEASRMARARDMGFGDQDLYHGTAKDFPAFSQEHRGGANPTATSQRADWLASEPETARTYAEHASQAPVQELINASYAAERRGDWDAATDLMAQAEKLEADTLGQPAGDVILPVRGPKNALTFDAEGMQYDPTDYVLMDKLKEAQNNRYPAVRINNFVDNADYANDLEADHLGVFNPANIRSRFARFDPRLKHLRNLSAVLAGAGVSLPMLMEEPYGAGGA